jgi:hypothetical protein
MKMRKSYPTVALITFLIGLTASYGVRVIGGRLLDLFTSNDVPRLELFNDAIESRDVYSAILQQSFIRHRYTSVVIETTSVDGGLVENNIDTGERSTVPQLFAQEHDVMPVEFDTLADYARKNNKQNELFLQDLGITNELISREEVAQLFGKGGGGWETFYKQHPGSLGLVSFSKVGFNSNHDQAFVYVVKMCHWLCGDGQYVLLNKENGQWVVKVVQELWVS